MDVLSSRVLLQPMNLARSQAFYGDVLGLAVYREFGPPDRRGVVYFLGNGLLEVSGHAEQPPEGFVGWSYALTLGLALVYLGEHYLVDLLAGVALTEGVRKAAPRLAPAAQVVSRAVQRLEAAAQG